MVAMWRGGRVACSAETYVRLEKERYVLLSCSSLICPIFLSSSISAMSFGSCSIA